METVNPEALVDGLEFLLVDAHTLFDPLTGLPGPALVLDRIDVALAARGDCTVASAYSFCTTRA